MSLEEMFLIGILAVVAAVVGTFLILFCLVTGIEEIQRQRKNKR